MFRCLSFCVIRWLLLRFPLYFRQLESTLSVYRIYLCLNVVIGTTDLGVSNNF